ncbi:hypothetical protein [Acidovorax temperans]|uniref:hypothetical protein n=1 Tax=Acidovorax temperans TaxID=80878 RepID=UPI0030D21399
MPKENLNKNADRSCGLVMPISPIDGCSSEHWAEVKAIVTDAVESITDFSFKVKLVSDADDVGVIQKRIVQNLYSSDIVVCDVSGKNPNVMFELGMRLAFDKPTVIIKDDKTDYSFDTGVIEHVPYRRDLRFANVVSFKKHLADKVAATLREASRDSNHSTFLKNFGTFSVASLKEAEVSSDKVVIEMLTELQSEVASLRRRVVSRPSRAISEVSSLIRLCIRTWRMENDCDSSDDLLGNESLYQFIEKEIDARQHFETRPQFIEAVNAQISKLTV